MIRKYKVPVIAGESYKDRILRIQESATYEERAMWDDLGEVTIVGSLDGYEEIPGPHADPRDEVNNEPLTE